MKFFKAVFPGGSVPLDKDEVEKVALANVESQKGNITLLILRQGMIDFRSPVHIAPDPEREKRYQTPYEDERKEIRESPDQFKELREKITEDMRIGESSRKQLGSRGV